MRGFCFTKTHIPVGFQELFQKGFQDKATSLASEKTHERKIGEVM